MTLLNNLHPNELFRFMHVRGAHRAPKEKVATYFIRNVYDDLPQPELAAVQRQGATLYPTLATRLGHPNQLDEQTADVHAYQKSKLYVADPDDYAQRFPRLTSFLDWLDAHLADATVKSARHRLKLLTGQDAAAYVKSPDFRRKQCVLWDNLIANIYAPAGPLLLTLACKYLAGLHLAEALAQDLECEEQPPDITRVYHSKPLVPKWVFEVLARPAAAADEGVGDQRREHADDGAPRARFEELDRAIRETRALIARREEAQRQEQRLAEPERDGMRRPAESGDGGARREAELARTGEALRKTKSPYELSREELGELGDLGGAAARLAEGSSADGGPLSLERLLGSLQREATAVAAELGSADRPMAVRVGDVIVSRKDLCAEMIDHDPCAARPRQNFATRGSYFNSVLVGDLLVTKQQLIRYDVGEVAHVEAVMQGLEKERTHRRLNRTETQTTFERESVNETEREQATNERFQVEKETAKTLEQEFKINTGTNFSADYGVVQFGASMDASFGVSQTQSQKTATSFSRDVTTRALSRVKETVRESQTVTVINEIEETSVHKLTNNTGDNVNGVYCWVDKFYLNKIINYGARMLFEYTVPEPANLFLFRKVTRPPAGAAVENPTPPSEVVGPDGARLTSPAALTDVNYAFWVAQYGAANVDAPPQEYVTLSKSFKSQNSVNDDDPADVYTTLIDSIDIPKYYEAVLADVNVEATSLGTSSFLTGFITTAYFSTGYTGNIGLPNVQTQVAVAISSHMTNYVCSMWVLTKRSPEGLNNWRLDAYGKIMEAYGRKKQAYDEWLNAQNADATFGFAGGGENPAINRATEREELKKRCLELFTGQRFESFDAASNGLQNVSGFPEILFRQAIEEGNVVRFFEQAFEWENMTYIFYPYFWGRKPNWPAVKNLGDPADPQFTAFLQAGYARVQVPARPGFENYLLFFNLISNLISFFGGSWAFAPSVFGALGISNAFSPGVNDPVYISVTQELINAAGLDEDNGTVIGHYVQKVPTSLVYVVPNSATPGSPLPGLPDNSADPEIQPYV